MGHNRAGVKRRQRLRRSKRELERLAEKTSPEPAKKATPSKGKSK
jgi:hypothetical protein